MKRSNNKNIRDDTAYLYERISRDDDLVGDSYSIANQKKLLIKAAKEKGYSKIVHFCDDGISGVTMNRPEFQKMLHQLEMGMASAVFVKDLSRLGRNYLEVGRLTEEVFPEHDVRLVAVSDNIDTCDGDDELAPIKNLFNEWYARDISRKRRASNKIQGNSGIPLGPPPYGYMKNPDNPSMWIVDEEAAAVVRRVVSLRFDGYGPEQIAQILTENKIVCKKTNNAFYIRFLFIKKLINTIIITGGYRTLRTGEARVTSISTPTNETAVLNIHMIARKAV